MLRSDATKPDSQPSVSAQHAAPDASGLDVHVSVEQLFRQHNEALLRFLTARLHSSQEAKEVAQEAYARMLGLQDPSTVSFLQGYLFRTAANLAANRLRDRASRQRINELVFFEEPEARSPEHARLAQEELSLLRRAIDELPEPCRSAFILVQFQDLSINEAARTLGLNSRRVRRFVERALEHCHKVVYEDESVQGGHK